MNTPTPREEFEEWLETFYDNSNILSPRSLAWEAWQAASEQLTAVTEQRDRLAEALKEYREALSDGPENCSYKMYEAVDEFAEKALQSLTPNEL